MAEIKELKDEVARLRDELHEVRKLVQVGKAVKVANVNQEKSRVDDSADTDSATLTLQNKFAVLQEETEPEPTVILVGNSLVSGQRNEFCRGKPNRKHRCYPGRKVEAITERVDYLVENFTENTLFVTVVGTNNLHRDTATDIVKRYQA
ncbi:hypothetical protein E2C01_034128 [Portunus trituberculatus]|uniref:Uncharacterized protein n=1 Tax=Portunus trituberculatus TaxID=210409 RepID=A0A5B7F4X6_PORTR|nr:hypothetical protein [Portunus trituberculatus]